MHQTAPRPAITALQKAETIVLLASLVSIAPFAIDTYLPALPTLATAFHDTPAAAERTLATFFLGFAFGQSIVGPLTDRFGRKTPLYFGLGLFVIASFACTLAPDLGTLAALRLLQALGACCGGVVSRAVVRDLFEEQEGAHVLSRMILVMGIAPLLAPIIGGYFLVWFGWKSIFIMLGCIGAAILLLAHVRLSETHDKANVRELHLGRIFADYWHLLRNRHFLGYGLGAGISSAGLFAYITASPHVYIDVFHVKPEHFGYLFGLNAFGFVLISQINAALIRRYPLRVLMLSAQTVQATGGIVLLIDAYTGFGGLWGIVIPLFFYTPFNGAVMPPATALAMQPHRERAGLASALIGTLQFGCSAIAATVVGFLGGSSPMPMAIIVATCGVGGLLFNRIMTR
ncbi:MAG TPA: Bcr/CflA family multidrug efflux MFS transporter [Rhizomicrobium sp.]|nr:Bcr/CflA family multidrug efflux MFS transporter [Rhizomicrobium sp.]